MTYYISDNGEAAVIDPLRDPYPYIRMAESDDAIIKYIFLTHFHADFVSGHLDLAQKTGATIVYGPNAVADFDFYCAKDKEKFQIGNIFLQLLHTPGHTLESSSFLLIDEAGDTPCVFTGDCLFLDDVGRPDLATVPGSLTVKDLAGMQFDSLRSKIMTLPDDIIVYPNHGSGSSCGKNMKSSTFDTLKNQKETNYALKPDMTKEEFIMEVTTGLETPPQYFPKNAKLNKSKLKDIDDIIYQATTPLFPDKFKEFADNPEYLVIDTRNKNDFIEYGTIPGALYIGIEANFANWVGSLIENIDQKIIFIADNESNTREIATRFSRVGYDNVKGYLLGGIHNWLNYGYDLIRVSTISSTEFSKLVKGESVLNVLDVRSKSDYLTGHLEGAINFPLQHINSNIHLLDKNQQYFLYCTSGYVSLIATSILLYNDYNVVNINGRYEELK